MSDNHEDTRGPVEQLPDSGPTAPQLGRRLFVVKAAAVLGGAAAALLGTSGVAQADTGFGHQDKDGKHDADKTSIAPKVRKTGSRKRTRSKRASH